MLEQLEQMLISTVERIVKHQGEDWAAITLISWEAGFERCTKWRKQQIGREMKPPMLKVNGQEDVLRVLIVTGIALT
jgi:hypothetical protein